MYTIYPHMHSLFKNCSGKMFASMYYQLWGSLVKIVGFVLQFVVLTIRSCQINHRYQRDVLLADFGKFGKSWRFAEQKQPSTRLSLRVLPGQQKPTRQPHSTGLAQGKKIIPGFS